MTKNVLLIDFSWLWTRSLFAFKDLTEEVDGVVRPTGGIFGVLKFAQSSAGWDFSEKVLCLDGYPTHRKKIYPDYKAHREVNEFKNSAKTLNPDLLRIMDYLNFPCVKNDDYEADDIIASMALDIIKQGGQVTVFTSDKDIMQLIPYGVKVANRIEEGKLVYVTQDYTVDKIGVAPELLRYFRPFKGDSSDNISSAAPRVLTKFLEPMAKEMKKLVEAGVSLDEAYDKAYRSIEGLLTAKAKTAFNKTQYLTNFALMDLLQYYYNTLEVKQALCESKLTTNGFLTLLDKLGMKDYKTFYLDTMAATGGF